MNIKPKFINKSHDRGLKLGKGLPPSLLQAQIILKSIQVRARAVRTAVISTVIVGASLGGLANVNASAKYPIAESSQHGTAHTITRDSILQNERSNFITIFKQAVADDAAGRHEQARKWYDALEGAELNFSVAVPSAVNLAVLGRYDDAKKAFAKIMKSDDQRAASYAQLWQLWLTARTYTGNPAFLQKELIKLAANFKSSAAYQQKLVAVFAGEGEVATVFTTINTTVAEGLPMRDARSEAAFFAGGYLQYIRKDTSAALSLYRRELPQSDASVEKPLIEQAIKSL